MLWKNSIDYWWIWFTIMKSIQFGPVDSWAQSKCLWQRHQNECEGVEGSLEIVHYSRGISHGDTPTRAQLEGRRLNLRITALLRISSISLEFTTNLVFWLQAGVIILLMSTPQDSSIVSMVILSLITTRFHNYADSTGKVWEYLGS